MAVMVDHKKILGLLGIVTLLVAPAASQNDWSFKPDETSAHEKPNLRIVCDGSTGVPSCPVDASIGYKYNLHLCSGTIPMTSSNRINAGVHGYVKYVPHEPKKLSEIGCKPGNTYTMQLEDDGDMHTVGDIKTTSTISGRYINVQLNVDSDPISVLQFHFTEDNRHESFEADISSSGLFMVNEDRGGNVIGTDAWAIYPGQAGEVIRAEPDFKLKQAAGSCNKDNCDRPEKVMDEPFSQIGGSYDGSKCSGGKGLNPFGTNGDCTLNYRTSQDTYPFQSRGDIYIGYGTNPVEPAVSGPVTESNTNPTKRFYICDPGNPNSDGLTVYGPSGNAYRCDSDSSVDQTADGEKWRYVNDGGSREIADWDRVYACSDGKDNDYNGAIDFGGSNPDAGCTSWDDTTEGGVPAAGGTSSQCTAFIGLDTSNGGKMAFYDAGEGSANPFNSDCGYKTEAASSIPTGSPQEFVCEEDGRADGYNTDSSRKEGFCSEIAKMGTGAFHGSNVSAVQYNIPPRSIPVSINVTDQLEAQSISYNDPGKTITESDGPSAITVNGGPFNQEEFMLHSSSQQYIRNSSANSGPNWAASTIRQECMRGEGFVTVRCETLHMAEQEYVDGNPHERKKWNSRGLQDTGSYDLASADEADTAWITRNTGADDPQVSGSGVLVDGDNSPEPRDVFTGGFAGRCGSGIWNYDQSASTWNCTQRVGGIQVDFINHYQYPNLENNYTGFRVRWEELKKWEQTFSQAPDIVTGNRRNNGPEGQPLKIQAQCWVGERGERPSDSSERINLVQEVQNSGEDVFVVGELPARSNDLVNNGAYTCIYGFSQYVNNYYLLSEGQEAFWQGTNLLTTSTTNPQEGVIVEGTGETGKIETVNNAFSLSDDYAVTVQPTQVGETDPATGNEYVLEQTFLQNRASSTVNENQLYTNFPTTSFADSSTPRNPIDFFEQSLNN
jgi:hypothetical protein